eukprot:773471_1
MNTNSWKCKECTFPNQSGSNCVVCGKDKISKGDRWNCNNCTFTNKSENNSCQICGHNNKHSNTDRCNSKRYPSTITQVNDCFYMDTSTDKNSWKCKTCTFVNQSRSNCLICNTKNGNDGWNCIDCTFVNESHNNLCKICSKPGNKSSISKNNVNLKSNIKSVVMLSK